MNTYSHNQYLIIAFFCFVATLFFVIIAFKFLSRENKIFEAKKYISENFPHWHLYEGMDLSAFFNAVKLTDDEAQQILNKSQRYAIFFKDEFCPIGAEQVCYLYTEQEIKGKRVGKWFFFAFTKRFQRIVKGKKINK